MLYLIGMGLWDETDMTLKGLEKAKSCDLIFLEAYTSELMGSNKHMIEKQIGKPIQLANREFIENGTILSYAQKNNAALLVVGDPMVATTHSDLILRCREKNIKYEIIHNASIYSAIGETGLQIYKFGRSATVTFWENDYRPTSWMDAYKDNSERGLHTLFFLDLNLEKKQYLNAQQAIKQMIEAGLNPETELLVCSKMGSPYKKIVYGKAQDLLNKDTGIPLQVIIIPGKLHEMEQKFLEMFRI